LDATEYHQLAHALKDSTEICGDVSNVETIKFLLLIEPHVLLLQHASLVTKFLEILVTAINASNAQLVKSQINTEDNAEQSQLAHAHRNTLKMDSNVSHAHQDTFHLQIEANAYHNTAPTKTPLLELLNNAMPAHHALKELLPMPCKDNALDKSQLAHAPRSMEVMDTNVPNVQTT
jgi:hypothetical protein